MAEKQKSTEVIIAELFAKNREWAKSIIEEDAQFFERLSQQQNPDYMWIGCADSRGCCPVMSSSTATWPT